MHPLRMLPYLYDLFFGVSNKQKSLIKEMNEEPAFLTHQQNLNISRIDQSPTHDSRADRRNGAFYFKSAKPQKHSGSPNRQSVQNNIMDITKECKTGQINDTKDLAAHDRKKKITSMTMAEVNESKLEKVDSLFHEQNTESKNN